MEKREIYLRGIFCAFLLVSFQASGQVSPEAEAAAQAGLLMRSAYAYRCDDKYDSSRVLFEKAAQIYKANGNWQREAYCNNGAAECSSAEGKFQKAIEVLEKERGDAAANGHESPETAFTRELLGYIYLNTDRTTDAARELGQALDIWSRALPTDSTRIANCLGYLGWGYTLAGRYAEAASSLKQALAIHLRRPGTNSLELAQTYLYLGGLENAQCEFDSAITYFDTCGSLLSARHNEGGAVAGEMCLWKGMAYGSKGDYVRALELKKQSIDIYRRLYGERHCSVAGGYVALGEEYEQIGDYHRAAYYLERGEGLMTENLGKDHSSLAVPLDLMARAYSRMREPVKALDCVERAIAIRRSALGEKHPELAYSYETRGDIETQLKRPEEAARDYSTALLLRKQVGGQERRYDIIRLMIHLGSASMSMGNLGAADTILHQALEAEKMSSSESRVQLAAVEGALGDLAMHRADFAGALRSYHRGMAALCTDFADTSVFAFPGKEQFINYQEAVALLASQGKAFHSAFERSHTRVRDLKASLDSYLLALRILKRSRRIFSTEDSRLSQEEETSTLFESALEVALEVGRFTGRAEYRKIAFAIAEQSKAQTLLEATRKGDVQREGGAADTLLVRDRMLRMELTRCENALAEGEAYPKDKMDALREKRFTLLQEIEGVAETIEREHPEIVGTDDTPLTLDQIERTLDDRTAIIEYIVSPRLIHAFVVRKDGFDAYSTPRPRSFAGDIQKMLAAIKGFDEQAYIEKSVKICSLLISPLRHSLRGVGQLVIVPDGVLCYLPFEVLLTGDGNPANLTTDSLPYLIRSDEILYSYSSAFYLRCRSGGTGGVQAPQSFLGFAPVFGGEKPADEMLASRYLAQRGDSTVLRSATVRGKYFEELPNSEKEVSDIHRCFSEKGLFSQEFLRQDATEEAFKANAGKYSVVHIATHGLVDEADPRMSALVFTPNDTTLSQEDGILYADEVQDLKLNADLVVLSSCESGVGKMVRGEGLMALTRGFFYAGARNVVFSLWRVIDRQTSDLMSLFYKEVLAGRSYSYALRAAKLKMIAAPGSAYPLNWAGFVLVGR